MAAHRRGGRLPSRARRSSSVAYGALNSASSAALSRGRKSGSSPTSMKLAATYALQMLSNDGLIGRPLTARAGRVQRSVRDVRIPRGACVWTTCDCCLTTMSAHDGVSIWLSSAGMADGGRRRRPLVSRPERGA